MTGIVRRRAAARRDLIEAYRYLVLNADTDLSDRFLNAVETTLTRLAASPEMGVLLGHGILTMAEMRYFPVDQFRKYLAFYRPIEGGIEIVRILHGSRDISAIIADELHVEADEEPNV